MRHDHEAVICPVFSECMDCPKAGLVGAASQQPVQTRHTAIARLQPRAQVRHQQACAAQQTCTKHTVTAFALSNQQSYCPWIAGTTRAGFPSRSTHTALYARPGVMRCTKCLNLKGWPAVMWAMQSNTQKLARHRTLQCSETCPMSCNVWDGPSRLSQ